MGCPITYLRRANFIPTTTTFFDHIHLKLPKLSLFFSLLSIQHAEDYFQTRHTTQNLQHRHQPRMTWLSPSLPCFWSIISLLLLVQNAYPPLPPTYPPTKVLTPRPHHPYPPRCLLYNLISSHPKTRHLPTLSSQKREDLYRLDKPQLGIHPPSLLVSGFTRAMQRVGT